MESTIRTAKETILHFIDKGINDPTFAPVHLHLTLDNCETKATRADLVRNGESLWNGRTYHGQMKGLTESYPKIDFTEFPWESPKNVSFKSVRSGELRTEMQRQIDRALEELPFQIMPLEDSSLGSWRDFFSGERPLDRYFYFKLFRKDVPKWITGLDKLRMSGSWKLFLPAPSPERDLIDRLFDYEHRQEELERLRALRRAPLTSREEAVGSLELQIAEELRRLAA